MLAEPKRGDLMLWLMGFLMRRGVEKACDAAMRRGWTFEDLGLRLKAVQTVEGSVRMVYIESRRWTGEFRVGMAGVSGAIVSDETGFMRDLAVLRLLDN